MFNISFIINSLILDKKSFSIFARKFHNPMKRLFSTRYTDNAISISMLVLRVALGMMMMVSHGYPKLMTFAQKSGSFPDPFHIGHMPSMAMAIFAEFFCSVLLMLGLLTRFACIPLIVTMCVALFVSHNGEIFGAGEKAAVFLVGFIAILFVGPGKVSLDKVISGK